MKLTPAEIAVAQLILMALSNGEIAASLNRSENTVKHHIERLYLKCGVNEDDHPCRVTLLKFLHVNRHLLGLRCLACDSTIPI